MWLQKRIWLHMLVLQQACSSLIAARPRSSEWSLNTASLLHDDGGGVVRCSGVTGIGNDGTCARLWL